MGRIRYRQLLFLIALIVPAVAIAGLGWLDLQAELTEMAKSQEKETGAIGESLLNKLAVITIGELASLPASTGTHSDPAVMFFGPVNQIEELEKAVGIQIDFPSLALNERDWIPIGEDAWLSLTPPAGVSGQPMVIAVRRSEIVQRLYDERKDSKTTIEIESDKSAAQSAGAGSHGIKDPALNDLISSGENRDVSSESHDSSIQSLGARFPGFRVRFPYDSGAHDLLAERQMYFAISLAFFTTVTLVGWYLMLRDTRNEVRIAEMRSQREVRIAELRSQFVANVSHELRTPLTSIVLFAETMQMRALTDPKTLAEHLDTIINEGKRLARLVNNVLNFSQIERGQMAYHMKPTPLADVVRSAARSMQFPLSEQGFHMNVDISDELPTMNVDRDALEQAILNLMANAMKYSGDSRDIALRLNSINGSALIQVMDRGIGIAPEEQKRIFEQFYRVESPESRAVTGVGIGLALVAHIAAGHGGSIEVESRLGEGSTFTIRIPIRRDGKS